MCCGVDLILIFFLSHHHHLETPFSFKNIIIIIIIRFREEEEDDDDDEEGLVLLSANTVPFVFERFFFARSFSRVFACASRWSNGDEAEPPLVDSDRRTTNLSD